MQPVFKEIVEGDTDAVVERLRKDPGLLAITATAPPKKYAGQSPLQVAVRSGQFAIATMLIGQGADPEFIDREAPDGWSAPVLHDAVTAAVMRSRWLRSADFSIGSSQWTLAHTKAQSDEAFQLLKLLLERGANPTALDSYENSLLGRAVLTARQVLPAHRYDVPGWVDAKPLNVELANDLKRTFSLLYEYGADPSAVDANLECALDSFYAAEPVGQFFNL